MILRVWSKKGIIKNVELKGDMMTQEEKEESFFVGSRWVIINIDRRYFSHGEKYYSGGHCEYSMYCLNDRGEKLEYECGCVDSLKDDFGYYQRNTIPRILVVFSHFQKYGISTSSNFPTELWKVMRECGDFVHYEKKYNLANDCKNLESNSKSNTVVKTCQPLNATQNNGVSYANGTSSTSGNIVRIQGEVEIEKIVSEIIKHFGSNCIYDGSGKKYVDDIAYGDANSVNRRRIKSVLSSGAIKNLKANGDFNDAVSILIKNTDWDENIAKKMIVSFANALGLRI